MEFRSLRRRATACLVLSLFALVLAVGQYILLMYLYVCVDPVSEIATWLFLGAWLGVPVLAFVFSVACFFCFGISRSQLRLFRARRIIGLIFGILSLPLNAFCFLFGTFCILIGG